MTKGDLPSIEKIVAKLEPAERAVVLQVVGFAKVRGELLLHLLGEMSALAVERDLDGGDFIEDMSEVVHAIYERTDLGMDLQPKVIMRPDGQYLAHDGSGDFTDDVDEAMVVFEGCALADPGEVLVSLEEARQREAGGSPTPQG